MTLLTSTSTSITIAQARLSLHVRIVNVSKYRDAMDATHMPGSLAVPALAALLVRRNAAGNNKYRSRQLIVHHQKAAKPQRWQIITYD
jgi:hypothetical protein